MRRTLYFDQDWKFSGPNGTQELVRLPHTWNNIDGQDGGNDYWRGTCRYETVFVTPDFDRDTEEVYLVFEGVNASADVTLNGKKIGTHDGGYSTFRLKVTDVLKDKNPEEEDNLLSVDVDNSINDRVYPQKADFTFYGGIYRDVSLLIVSKNHFAVDPYSTSGLKVTATPLGKTARITVDTYQKLDRAEGAEVRLTVFDADGKEVLQKTVGSGEFNREKPFPDADAFGKNDPAKAERAPFHAQAVFRLEEPHLWNGVKDPYLYTAEAVLVAAGKETDRVSARFGIRSFKVDPKKGFFLNGKSYPLRGVSRHQDRKGLGNAITKEMHDEDMALICEMGANTVRLAHYQHDQYFYDLCDEKGMVVWAEIPYISEHMPAGRENTIHQMKELITQNYNHACIVCWGVSNEITISTKDNRDMLDNHHVLNNMIHRMDPSRFTTLACYAMCGPFNRVAHITDVVSWNLYLGWYVPGLFLNDLWMGFFHTVFPNRALGFSEYGAEGMPNLHSDRPRRGDHSEEYQAIYHEYMLECFERHPYLWATHVWNMFDFAADARDQGGEPGMNHKGLVTFDRKTKKDSFYLYKAWWKEEPMVHICSKRFADRTGNSMTVKVYTNEHSVALYCNDVLVGEKGGSHVLTFQVPLNGDVHIRAAAEHAEDTADFRKTAQPNPAYKLKKSRSKSANWV